MAFARRRACKACSKDCGIRWRTGNLFRHKPPSGHPAKRDICGYCKEAA